jgi:HEPN domain-containing protein
MTNIDALLNDFATRSFRDVADHDYIAARLSYRHGLISQFHWQALQALEKYLKAILLYNRIKAKNINHDLAKALKHTDKLPFTLDVSPPSVELIKHIDNFGRFRYLETSYFTHGPKLVQLDKAVWEIRRYCRVLNFEIKLPGGGLKNMLNLEIDKIERSVNQSPHKFRVTGGALEKILDKKEHTARAALVWQNGYFTGKSRKFVKSPTHFYSVNAPLSLHPEILEEVLKYIFIPTDVVNAYKEDNK